MSQQFKRNLSKISFTYWYEVTYIHCGFQDFIGRFIYYIILLLYIRVYVFMRDSGTSGRHLSICE